MNYSFQDGLDFAKSLDKQDSLAKFKERFYSAPGSIYMDGNSLGLCSKDAEEALLKMLDVWKKDAISLWSKYDGHYFLYQDYLAKLTAPLINADPEEITIMSTVTMNIHSGIATFYKPTKTKYKILVDDLNFPTDRHAIDSQVILKGLSPDDAVKVVKSKDGVLIDEDAVIQAMTDDVAIVFLPAVLYRSAQLLDMERITAEAKKRGIYVGWDLCHSIGAVPHDFKKIDCDFAVWCTYKYMSGGPGSLGGFYINKKHFGMIPGLAGWHGNKKDTQFQLNHKHDHAHNAGGWQTGTLALLSCAPIEGALKIFAEAGIHNIRKKSLQLTAYLCYLINLKLAKYGCVVGNPMDDNKRGGHVCLEHKEAFRVCQALKEKLVTPDFREPNVVRLAPTALYNSYEDVYKLVDILDDIFKNKLYEKFSNTRGLVV